MLRGIKRYITIILISLIVILLFASNKSRASTLGVNSMFYDTRLGLMNNEITSDIEETEESEITTESELTDENITINEFKETEETEITNNNVPLLFNSNLYDVGLQRTTLLAATPRASSSFYQRVTTPVPSNMEKIIKVVWIVNGRIFTNTTGISYTFARGNENKVISTIVYYKAKGSYRTLTRQYRNFTVVSKILISISTQFSSATINVGETIRNTVVVNPAISWSVTSVSSNLSVGRSGRTLIIKGIRAGTGSFIIKSTLGGATVQKTITIRVRGGAGEDTYYPPSGGGSGSTGSGGTSSGSGSVYVPPPDTTPPSCTVTADKSGITNASQITYTIKFSESVSGFDSSDITLNKGSIARLTGSGSSYTAIVNTEASEYTQTLSIGASVCTDTAGNGNTASNSVSVQIDRVKPKVEFLSATTNNSINSNYASKNHNITVKLKVTDTNFKNTSLTTDGVGITVGNSLVAVSSETVSISQTAITNGAEITLTLHNITGDGKLKVSVLANQLSDNAGNTNDLTESTSNSSINITIDNTKPEVTKSSITGDNGNGYIRNGQTAKITMTFSEDLYKAPEVKIGGRVATVTGSKKDYTATLLIPEDEKDLVEGKLSIEISNYSDIVGLVGETETSTTDGSTLIYDRTPPEIQSISPNGDTTWRKEQSTVISATDNLTPQKDIGGKYTWQLQGESATNFEEKFVNESKLVKNTGTGKYLIYLRIEDLAGNVCTGVTNPFYLDNSVTEVGQVIITRNSIDGEKYGTHKNSENQLEGGYTKDSLYLHKVDGKDDESGHKRTVYKVERIEANGELIAVGKETTEDTKIETDGDYKVTVTTWDNLDNVDYRYYILHIGSTNITFEPNGNSEYESEVSTKVVIKDTLGLVNEVYYKWVKEGEEEPTAEEITTRTSNNQTIKLTNQEGEYRLYIKTIDSDGNETIGKSEIFHIAGKITNMGKMVFKENNAEGKEYIPETFTNQNVYMKIEDHGSDEHGGKVTSSYKVVKKDGQNETVVGEYTNESTVLTQNGQYEVTLTSKSELGAINTAKYIINIDKKEPSITFEGSEDYQNTGRIRVTIIDEEGPASGINTEEMRFYWTRSTIEPTEKDFKGEESEYRGKISSTTQSIETPKNVSGIWYLWVYAKDNCGNIAIKSNVEIDDDGNISYVDNEAPIPGTLIMKENDKNGKDYQEGTFTKENIYVELLNGYDADSGVKSNTYSITKNGQNYKSDTEESITLTEHGTYKVTIKTVDNKNNEATREYTIKIDKEAPRIELLPDGNKEYAKQHEITVNITEPEDESGVNTQKNVLYWISYDREKYENINKALEKIQEQIDASQGNLEEEFKEKLAQEGIEIIKTTIENNKVKTPEGKTGIYYLLIHTEDLVGNGKSYVSQGYGIDNINPSKPEVSAVKIKNEVEENYHGEYTNYDVKIIAKNSKAESRVDKYEYSISQDNGATWSEYKEMSIIKNDEVIGELLLQENMAVLVKVKAVAELLDGRNESEESEIITVKIDKIGPNVEFANHQNGENGYENPIKEIQVRAVVTDEQCGSINENSLKYEWIKFESIEEYKAFVESEKSFEELKQKMSENQKVFKNGEELPSPTNAEGIYSMFVYAEDILRNASIKYSNYYNLGEEKGNSEETEEYEIQGKYIINVLPETNVNEFMEKIKSKITGNEFNLYNKDGEEKKETEENKEIVATGDKLLVDGKEYKISVIGDLNGDGIVNIQDISCLQFHILEVKELTEEYKISADLNNDSLIDMIDLSRMIQMIAGIR